MTFGGIGQIVGEELKFDPTNAAEGIYFVAANGTASKVIVVASRTEGKLMFDIRTLAVGTCTLEVRKGYGTMSPKVRTGILQDALVIN